MTAGSYESFFGLVERPFSLTPDPKYFFKSRSHGRALESLIFGLRRRDKFLLLTGDLGLGKTTVCRTLMEQVRRRTPVAYAPHALFSPADLLRLLLHDFAAASDEIPTLDATSSPEQLDATLVQFLGSLKRAKEGAVLIVDEAHNTPAVVMGQLKRLSSIAIDGQQAMHIVLSSQPTDGDASNLGIRSIDAEVATRARLLPFGREDCAAYVAHRLTIAGGASVSFTPRAIDVLFGLSGGVPRLVNLLCERALQESATREMRKIEPVAIESAASALELLRARPKRFRWFNKRVS
jgi:general secretion pathway protein A